MRTASVIRDDLDVERAPVEDLRAYVYDLEDAVRALAPDATAAKTDRLYSGIPGLAPTGARILALLADGRIRTKEAIVTHIYAGRIDEAPDKKIVDVYVCKIRKALAGMSIAVETAWGTGYHVTDPDGDLRRLLDDGVAPPVDAARRAAILDKPHAGGRGASHVMDALVRHVGSLGEKAVGDVVTTWPVALSPAAFSLRTFCNHVRRAEALGLLRVICAGEGGCKNSRPWRLALTDAGRTRLAALRQSQEGGR